MILDIMPLRDERRFCYEDIFASLAQWWGRDYQLMYTEVWRFLFDIDDSGDKKLLCNRIDTGNWSSLLLQKYHGIKILDQNFTSCPGIISIILKELSFGRPTILAAPGFWCPWSPAYQKVLDQNRHAFLVVGIDEKNHNLICTDPYYMKHIVHFPIKDLRPNCISVQTLELIEPNTKITWQQVIGEAVSQVTEAFNSFADSFSAIRYLADEIMDITDILSEMQGGINGSICDKLSNIDFSRRRFSLLLEYFGEKFKIPKFLSLSDDMLKAASKWNASRSILLKIYYLNKDSPDKDLVPMLKRVSFKIKEAAECEERVADALLDAIHKKDSVPSWIVHTESLPMKNYRQIAKIEFLDLSYFFNNNCFGSEVSNNCVADINGYGCYILSGGLPLDRTWQVGYRRFRFPSINESVVNNISCLAQTISLPAGKYYEIMVLGCAVMGNQIESFVVEYEGGDTDEICLELTDLWLAQPAFDERLAWQGQYVNKMDLEEPEIVPHKVSIYAQSYTINHFKDLISIRLPFCPNIHIFAISLMKCLDC